MVAWWSAAACLCMFLACWFWRVGHAGVGRTTTAQTRVVLAEVSHAKVRLERWAVGLALLAVLLLALAGMQVVRIGRLLPVPSAAADLDYYLRVHGRLSALEQSPSLPPERLAVITALRRNLLEWTAVEIVDNSELAAQRGALAALAHDIDFDSVDTLANAEYLASERKVIEERLASLANAIAATNLESEIIAKQFAAVGTADSDDAEAVEQKRQLASELTAVETQLQQLRRDVRRLKDRQQWRQQMAQAAVGVNSQHSWLKLPVVVPGGWRWWLAYWFGSVLAVLLTMALVVKALPRRTPVGVLVVGLYGVLWWLAVS